MLDKVANSIIAFVFRGLCQKHSATFGEWHGSSVRRRLWWWRSWKNVQG